MSTEHSDQASSERQDGAIGTADGAQSSSPNTQRGGSAAISEETESNDVDEALQESLAEVARIKEQLLRTAADFDNFRKRSRREAEDAERRGREETVRELLPVFDNLERAVLHAGQASDAKSVADGVSMVLRQFLDTLGRVGIKRTEAVGTPFDPAKHEAVQQIESAEYPPGTVAIEIQPGYMIGDKLLRAAIVVVAKAAEKKSDRPAPASN